jgi:3D (Asp-Asp-Asp) domain-containing protein
MKVIAVSQDLIPVGLDRHTPVKIEGFPDVYLVLDKMHKRWEKRIDIYMGHDLEAARAWGKRQVEISW